MDINFFVWLLLVLAVFRLLPLVSFGASGSQNPSQRVYLSASHLFKTVHLSVNNICIIEPSTEE